MSYSRQRLLFALALALLLTAQLAFYARYQPQIEAGNGRGDDGVTYGSVADQFLAGVKPSGAAPFVYRLGVPWLASQVSRISGIAVDDAFRVIDIVALYVLIALIYVLALRYCQPIFAFIVCLLYLAPFYGYVRLAFFYPVLVDTLWMVVMIASLLIMSQERLSLRSIVLLGLLTMAGTLMRETGILIPVTFFLSLWIVRRVVSVDLLLGLTSEPLAIDRAFSSKRLFAGGVALLSIGVLALLISHLAATGTGDYSFFQAAKGSAASNHAWHLIESAFLAFGGPMVALLAIKPNIALMHFRAAPSHLIFIVLALVTSFFGGVNTVRFMSWASPLVLIAICLCFQHAFRELTTQPVSASKRIVQGTLVLVLIYSLVSLHPLDGFYRDYSAWVAWGGLQFSRLDMAEMLLFMGITLTAILVWRWFSGEPLVAVVPLPANAVTK